jgi:hypothetical protein
MAPSDQQSELEGEGMNEPLLDHLQNVKKNIVDFLNCGGYLQGRWSKQCY